MLTLLGGSRDTKEPPKTDGNWCKDEAKDWKHSQKQRPNTRTERPKGNKDDRSETPDDPKKMQRHSVSLFSVQLKSCGLFVAGEDVTNEAEVRGHLHVNLNSLDFVAQTC